MGWASGSELANEVWNEIQKYIPKEKQQRVARKIVGLFENWDADDWCNPDGIEAIAYPEWFKEE